MQALIEKELRLTEQEIVFIRERYDVSTREALFGAIRAGSVSEHPAWEDYIVWKNKDARIVQLQQLVS